MKLLPNRKQKKIIGSFTSLCGRNMFLNKWLLPAQLDVHERNQNNGKNCLSSVNLDIVSLVPDLTQENFSRTVKDWILSRYLCLAICKLARHWFRVPYLPLILTFTPQQPGVLISHFSTWNVCREHSLEIKGLKIEARDSDKGNPAAVISPRKNALRHGYWNRNTI